MKNILRTLLILIPLFFTSCTTNERLVKKQALAESESQFNDELVKEAQDQIAGSDWLRNAYVEFIKKHTDFSVDDVQFQGETLAVAATSISTYPKKMRLMLVAIAGRVPPEKVRQFNFAYALQLLGEQFKVKVVPEKQKAGVFKFQKDSSGNWTLQK